MQTDLVYTVAVDIHDHFSRFACSMKNLYNNLDATTSHSIEVGTTSYVASTSIRRHFYVILILNDVVLM